MLLQKSLCNKMKKIQVLIKPGVPAGCGFKIVKVITVAERLPRHANFWEVSKPRGLTTVNAPRQTVVRCTTWANRAAVFALNSEQKRGLVKKISC